MQLRSVGTVMTVMNQQGASVVEALLCDLPLRPVRAVMVEQRGVCEHQVGEVLTFRRPWEEPDRPICPGLLGALRPFLAAAAAGVPADRHGGGYTASCPSAKGTVWRIEEGV